MGYEMVWARQFATGLGHELPGVLAVIAAFLAGLALGSWFLDGPISRSNCPGRWYASLELFIGLWAFVSLLLIPLGNQLAWRLIGLEPSPLRHYGVAFLLPLLLLLPATAAMGATLPAIDRLISRLTDQHRSIGALYGTNTLGAVAGVLTGAFVLAPSLGLSRSVWLFATLNLLCGGTALVLTRKLKSIPLTTASSPGSQHPMPRLFITLAIAGALGIGYEVVGIRVLSQVLENTVYTFASILSVYLLGTATGAAWYQRRGRRQEPFQLAANLLCALSVACAAGALASTRAHAIYSRSWWPNELTAELAIAAVVFLPATALMGALFSLLVQQCRHASGGVGKAAALNTIGGALAPAIFGVALLPIAGCKWAFILIALGYLTLLPKFSSGRFLFALAPAALALLPASAWNRITIPPGGKLVAWHEGIMATVAVVEGTDGHRLLRVNNRFQMGGTAMASTEARQAHLPLLLHPDPQRVLFLGLGTGISFGAAATYPGVLADGVELVPEVAQVLPQFQAFNENATRNPRLKTFVADARRFVSVTDQQYDVIVADLFHPARDGAGTLYSLEHFQAIKKHLRKGGLFCQWLPLHQLDLPLLKTIVRTFLGAFPETRAYLLEFSIDAPVLGLVGNLEPPRYNAKWIEPRLASEPLLARLKEAALNSSIRLFGRLVAGPEALEAFATGAPLNTDDRPRVLFDAPRAIHLAEGAQTLRRVLSLSPTDPTAALHIDDAKFLDRLRRFLEARTVYLQGLMLQEAGQQEEALEAFVASARISPEFTAGYAQCLSLVSVLIQSDPSSARRLLERLDQAQPSRSVARQLLEKLAEH